MVLILTLHISSASNNLLCSAISRPLWKYMVSICISSALRVVSSSQPTPKKASQREGDRDRRHCADFPPSIWGEHFTRYSNNDMVCSRTQKEIQELKAGVKKKLKAVSDKPSQHLNLIDAIDGLGLGYHFEDEIEEAMASMFDKSHSIIGGYDLYSTSLHFRLLRKHGYRVPSDIFNKFVDACGRIKEELHVDIRGLLGLYEAAQLRVHEDVILDQALNASVGILESSPISKMDIEVKRALKLPLHKDVPRLRARRYISTYGHQTKYSHDANLLKMAKLDFNLLQHQHQYELSLLTKWWKDLGMASKCPFARDRMVEIYLWSLAMFFEPQYGFARAIFTKVAFLITIFDDIYDAYGTADELELLTEAFFRWNRSLMEQMPEFMQAPYEALLDFVEEIERNMAAQGKSYRTDYTRKVLQLCFKGYHDQQIWFMNNHVPTMEEYLKVGVVTGTGQLTTIVSMVGMEDDDITEDTFEWAFSNPKMIIANSTFNRLQDDIATHKFEQERRHAPSSVECYMNQYGVSEQEAHKALKGILVNAWKDMNEGCFKPTAAPLNVLERILNIARLGEVTYKDGDGFTQAQELLKDEVTSILVNPIPI